MFPLCLLTKEQVSLVPLIKEEQDLLKTIFSSSLVSKEQDHCFTNMFMEKVMTSVDMIWFNLLETRHRCTSILVK